MKARIQRREKYEMIEPCQRLEADGYECTRPITPVKRVIGKGRYETVQTYYIADYERDAE